MALPRKQARRAPSRNGVPLTKTVPTLSTAETSAAKIPGRKRRPQQVVDRMVLDYTDVAAKAKKAGRAYMISYRVTPDGKAEPVEEAPDETQAARSLAGALERAKARGAIKVAEILKGPDMLTGQEFAREINTSHETVNAKRKRHEILGLEGATRGVRYPRWQVTESGMLLPGLARLFTALGEQPWTVYRFLSTSHGELGGRTALDALKAGQLEAVLGVANNQVTGVFT